MGKPERAKVRAALESIPRWGQFFCYGYSCKGGAAADFRKRSARKRSERKVRRVCRKRRAEIYAKT